MLDKLYERLYKLNETCIIEQDEEEREDSIDSPQQEEDELEGEPVSVEDDEEQPKEEPPTEEEDMPDGEEEPEKQYFGKGGEENYFYLNKTDSGYYISDAEGKIVYPVSEEERKFASDDVVEFLAQAQRELEMTEISVDIFTRYFEPALDKELKRRNKEAGYWYEEPLEDEDEDTPTEEEPIDFSLEPDEEEPLPVESKQEDKENTLQEFTDDQMDVEVDTKLFDLDGPDIPKSETIEPEYGDDHPRLGFESLHKHLVDECDEDDIEDEDGEFVHQKQRGIGERRGLRKVWRVWQVGQYDFVGEIPAETMKQAVAKFAGEPVVFVKGHGTESNVGVCVGDSGSEYHAYVIGVDESKQDINETVQELIHEIPGITKEEKKALQWALDTGKIRNEWPTTNQMLRRLRGFDTGREELEDYSESELKIDYLTYVLAPLAYEMWIGSLAESKIPVNEVRFVFDEHEFDVELVEDNESGTIININDTQKFEFTPEFTRMFRDEGIITEDNLRELAKVALANIEEDFFNEIALAGQEQVEESKQVNEQFAGYLYLPLQKLEDGKEISDEEAKELAIVCEMELENAIVDLEQFDPDKEQLKYELEDVKNSFGVVENRDDLEFALDEMKRMASTYDINVFLN